MAFLQEFANERKLEIEGFSDDVLEIFDNHPWTGNVRELRNVIERAVLFCRGGKVEVDDLPNPMRRPSNERAAEVRDTVMTFHEAVEQAEIRAIKAALVATNGRRADAAELLGVSRKTLWEKIKNLGVEFG